MVAVHPNPPQPDAARARNALRPPPSVSAPDTVPIANPAPNHYAGTVSGPTVKSRRDPAIRQGSLLLSSLVLTHDEHLPRFAAERAADPELDPARLKRARDLLDVVIEALGSETDEPWARVDAAWGALFEPARASGAAASEALPKPEAPPIASETPARSAPQDAAPVSPWPGPARLRDAPPPSSPTLGSAVASQLAAGTGPVAPPPLAPPPLAAPPSHVAMPVAASAPIASPPVASPPVAMPASQRARGGLDGAAIDSTHDSLSVSMLELDATPFDRASPARLELVPVAATLGTHENAGSTGHEIPALPDEVLPFREIELTLEQYASFCVERERAANVAPVAARYGVHDHQALDRSWQERFAAERGLRARFDELSEAYRRWLDRPPA